MKEVVESFPGVRVGGDQLHPAQASGDEVAQERQPAGAVLAAGDLHAQHLPVAVGVHAGGHRRVHGHDPSALPDFEHERVGGDERERAGVRQGAGAKLLDVRVEFPGHVNSAITALAGSDTAATAPPITSYENRSRGCLRRVGAGDQGPLLRFGNANKWLRKRPFVAP